MPKRNETYRQVPSGKAWSVFLDRDGVLNTLLPGDYVKCWEEFEFLPLVPEALAKLSKVFGHVFIVTNQQGIGKGLMTVSDLQLVHERMEEQVGVRGGSIDRIYFCPDLEASGSPYRKPNIGMALQAKKDFPSVNLHQSVMVGDSFSDMLFGKRAGMVTVLVAPDNKIAVDHPDQVDHYFPSLFEFSNSL